MLYDANTIENRTRYKYIYLKFKHDLFSNVYRNI